MESAGIGFSVDALLAPQQALTAYFARADLRAPAIEFVPIERALGRTLAQRAIADAPYPAAPRSAMDGFAVRSSRTPGTFSIAGEIRMGHAWDATAADGVVLRIPTGGVVPPAFDAVVPIEDAPERDGVITVSQAVPAGDCITPAGADMRAGETLLEPGRRIGAAELGVLATLGVAQVPVFRRPVFAVISSGDELVDVRSTPSPAQIRDSNRWAVAGALEALGASVRHFPTAPDEPAALEAILREAHATTDAIAITGGSSVGERDLTPQIVARLGEPGVIVHGLRVKPGKPTLLACADGKPVIGLPGNPASALLILDAVAAPIVRAISGAAAVRHSLDARLGAPYAKRRGWTWFVPVRVDEAPGGAIAYPLELRSSSASLLARADGYVILDENTDRVAANDPVRVMRFVGS